MGDDNIFLSNSDSAALYCVAKIFPDGENILIYKVNIINASSKKDVFFYESPTSTHNDIMGGGGMSYAYEYDVKYNICHLGSDSNLLIVFYVQIMPDDLVMQLHRF